MPPWYYMNIYIYILFRETDSKFILYFEFSNLYLLLENERPSILALFQLWFVTGFESINIRTFIYVLFVGKQRQSFNPQGIPTAIFVPFSCKVAYHKMCRQCESISLLNKQLIRPFFLSGFSFILQDFHVSPLIFSSISSDCFKSVYQNCNLS